MDLTLELEKVQEQIQRLQDETDDFEKKSTTMIEDDRVTVSAKVRASVESIERAQTFLEMGRSEPTAKIEYKGDAEEKVAMRALVWDYAADLSVKFNELRKAASAGLNNVADVKARWHDFEAEVCQLCNRIQTLAEEGQAAITSAEELLEQNERSIRQASETLKAQEVQLQELRTRAESRRDDRNALLIGAGASLLVSFLFLPAVVAIAPLVGSAGAKQGDICDLEHEMRQVDVRLNSLRSESETLGRQKISLHEAMEETLQLLPRSETLRQRNNATQAIVDEKLNMYHAFKASADKVGAWTCELTAQIEAMELVGPSEKALREIVQRIVGSPSEEACLGDLKQLPKAESHNVSVQ